MAKQQAGKTPKSTTPKTTPAKELAPDTPRSSRARTTTRKAATLPTHQEIAARAFARYLERGCVPGFEREDWLAAEAELTGRKI